MPRKRDREYGGYYEPTRPIEVQGGIRAQSKRGAFAKNWWAKRWLAVLEGFHVGARLGRGRSYARRGQVLDIEIGSGQVKAEVQGSRAKPYRVSIKVKTLSKSDWEKVAAALSDRPIYGAKLLANEMPEDIETVFSEAGVSLFPERRDDIETECSCPDWSNPCKHIAAVYYLMGEAFDGDPFLIFRLRGITREALFRMVGGRCDAAALDSNPMPGDRSGATAPDSDPPPDDPDAFWKGKEPPADLLGAVERPALAASLLKQLGPFPFWRGSQSPVEALEQVYQAASERGIEAALAWNDEVDSGASAG